MTTITRTVQFKPNHAARRLSRQDRPKASPGRIPRISRLMALAIRFDRLIREGKIEDQSALARLAHVSQPRITQIMNLNRLAPDIQEALLFLPRTVSGRDTLHERMLRPIAACVDWREQRRQWARLRTG